MSHPRACAVLAMTAGLVMSAVPVARAHYVKEQHEVWTTSDQHCVESRAEISHGNWDGGFSAGHTEFTRDFGFRGAEFHCTKGVDRPPHHLMAQPILMVELPSEGTEWTICRDPGKRFNPEGTWSFRFQTHFMSPPCGDGIYGVMTYSSVFWQGQWIPAADGALPVWSGVHVFGYDEIPSLDCVGCL